MVPSPVDMRSEQPLRIESDPLGTVASIIINSSVYTEAVIFKAAYWYTERFYLFLACDDDPQRIRVELRPKQSMGTDLLAATCREFCNALIDYRVRQEVLSETSEIRDILLQKAFGEGKQHLDPEKLGSDESRVPRRNQGFREDALDIGHLTGAE
jgi:His-Xaa-Ser system protein HxsD